MAAESCKWIIQNHMDSCCALSENGMDLNFPKCMLLLKPIILLVSYIMLHPHLFTMFHTVFGIYIRSFTIMTISLFHISHNLTIKTQYLYGQIMSTHAMLAVAVEDYKRFFAQALRSSILSGSCVAFLGGDSRGNP